MHPPDVAHDSGATLPDRIGELAKERGWSMREFARRAGLPDGYVGTIVSRLRRNPASGIEMDTLEKIARAAGVRVEWLATGNGQKASDEGPRIERDPSVGYSESEAPILANLPDWPELPAAARALDAARGVPAWAFEVLAYSNGLLTVPLLPGAIVDLAKTVTKYVAPSEAEATLQKLRGPRPR